MRWSKGTIPRRRIGRFSRVECDKGTPTNIMLSPIISYTLFMPAASILQQYRECRMGLGLRRKLNLRRGKSQAVANIQNSMKTSRGKSWWPTNSNKLTGMSSAHLVPVEIWVNRLGNISLYYLLDISKSLVFHQVHPITMLRGKRSLRLQEEVVWVPQKIIPN